MKPLFRQETVLLSLVIIVLGLLTCNRAKETTEVDNCDNNQLFQDYLISHAYQVIDVRELGDFKTDTDCLTLPLG